MSDYRVYEQNNRYATHPVDPKKCRKRMFKAYSAYQCSRPAVVEEEGYGWCRQHAPSAAKARDNARMAQLDEQSRVSRYRMKQDRLEREIVTAALNWYAGVDGGTSLLNGACHALQAHLAESPRVTETAATG